MKSSIRVRLRISGRVQGVCYRASAREKAQQVGLTGWVRNLMDGRVEALVEGSEENIESFVRWCWEGPRSAEVSDVKRDLAAAGSELSGFQIRY